MKHPLFFIPYSDDLGGSCLNLCFSCLRLRSKFFYKSFVFLSLFLTTWVAVVSICVVELCDLGRSILNVICFSFTSLSTPVAVVYICTVDVCDLGRSVLK